MQKVIRIGKKVIVLFEDGSYMENDNVSDSVYKAILDTDNEEEVYKLLCPSYEAVVQECLDKKKLLNTVKDSHILVLKGDSVYWEAISRLSLPFTFIQAIINAEKEGNEELIETYKNFWTLMSLNPDEECRKNLFWFLDKWGLKIAKCGFFVAYRNAVKQKTEEDGTEVYTDAHSGSTRIKIGEIVSIPRKNCDCDSSVSCSRGLHAGGAGWLTKNYYGEQGLVVLINPADVVAVPPLDNYGKLRTCAYLPIRKAEFDASGNIIEINEKDGFDCGYVSEVIYTGLLSNNESESYKIEIPVLPGINNSVISDNLLEIAKGCIINRAEWKKDT